MRLAEELNVDTGNGARDRAIAKVRPMKYRLAFVAIAKSVPDAFLRS